MSGDWPGPFATHFRTEGCIHDRQKLDAIDSDQGALPLPMPIYWTQLSRSDVDEQIFANDYAFERTGDAVFADDRDAGRGHRSRRGC
ncbi:hypothetical protein CHELA40_10760 [Chelatococcus asaccharovorans]|nr:hypothetical protein CHELA40_10760 [Chelatococcus asaccharovorans]CAH1686115.1 hypothetical protein CHELA17_64845 [Chelatococcus asaccharovorans]